MMSTARKQARTLLGVAFLLWVLAALLWLLAALETAGRISPLRAGNALLVGVAFLADYGLIWLVVWTRYALRSGALQPRWWRLWAHVAWPAAFVAALALTTIAILH